MGELTLSALYVYPLKSGAALAPPEWEVDGFGLEHDRRWMVIDATGSMISQRTHPRLALVRPSVGDGTLRIETDGMPAIELPLHLRPTVLTTAIIWEDRCEAVWVGERAARWFSEVLDAQCSLVYMPDGTVRRANPSYAPPGTRVSFADAYPFLLLSEESLADLNSRMAEPLPMNRFRPNLVWSGGEPFEEDRRSDFSLGPVDFRAVKPCDRCVVTTVDQATGARGLEPLRTLATYRKRDGQVYFGQNLVHWGTGRLRVGERVGTQHPRHPSSPSVHAHSALAPRD
jgi:uncharacterized protein